MKQLYSNQANRRYRSVIRQVVNGIFKSRHMASVMLISACLCAGSVAWAQTRGANNETSRRSSTRTEKASDARTEKKATEKKATETRSATTQREAVKKEAEKQRETTRQQETSRQRDASTRRETEREESAQQRSTVQQQQQQQQQQRGADIRQNNGQRRPVQTEESVRGGRPADSRVAPSTRMSSGYRPVADGRRPVRTKVQIMDHRYKHDRERCGICFGVGFIFAHDNIHRIRCSHCYGRGFALDYFIDLDDVCPLCYGSVSVYGDIHRRTKQSTARYVSNRLDDILNLSRSQEQRIYRIVLEYLRESRYSDWYDWVVIRDRKIMRELSFRQRERYIDFMNELDSRDFCDRCFGYF